MGTRPSKYQKFPLFGNESPLEGEPLDRFLKHFYGLLYAQLPHISFSNLMRFISQVTELLLRNRASVIYPEFFGVPCRKKLCVGSKNDWQLL